MDKLSVFCTGIIVGIAATLVLIGTADGTQRLKAYGEMVNQCEINLPRNEKCAMIAVHKPIGEKK